jgi:spoIIIJ-associated protein
VAPGDSVEPAADVAPEMDPDLDVDVVAHHAGGSEEISDPGGQASGSKRSSTLRRLEEEGEVAADYLEELLDIADIDGDIDIDVENGRASVGIMAESSADRTLRRLIGSEGEVLEALQELTRLAVQAATGERSRLMLDVAGFRANRRRTLEGVAARACQEVQRSGEPYRLDPMTAFERKVVHDVVADAGLVSESEGEDPDRRVVIKPA